jgi:hypothetical protein
VDIDGRYRPAHHRASTSFASADLKCEAPDLKVGSDSQLNVRYACDFGKTDIGITRRKIFRPHHDRFNGSPRAAANT